MGDLVVDYQGTIGIVTDIHEDYEVVLHVYDNKIDGHFDVSSMYGRYFGRLNRP